MKKALLFTPDTDTGSKLSVPARLVRKRVVAAANSVSLRTCDNWLRVGCPHVKVSPRLALFDLDEVETWLKEKFGTRRRGPAHATATATP
jgi:hypothetical protein